MKTDKSMSASERMAYWSSHLNAASMYEGPTQRYCEEQGINRETLRYWKIKLGGKALSAERKASSTAASAFAGVRVAVSAASNDFFKVDNPVARSSNLPDARWLAELITHLGHSTLNLKDPR